MSNKRTKHGRRSSRRKFLRQRCEFFPANLPLMHGANVRWGISFYDGVCDGIMVWRRQHYAFFLWRDWLDDLRDDLLYGSLYNGTKRIFVVVELTQHELECACMAQTIAMSSGRDSNRYDWKPNRRITGPTFPDCTGKLSYENYRKLIKPFDDVVRATEKKPNVGWFWR